MDKMYPVLIVVTLICGGMVKSVSSFDLRDPKTNLDSFMKTIKSTFYNETCLYLFNGTIYSRKPGQTLQKLFYFDGFSIGRNVEQGNGGYLDLNRDFGVFRDLKTNEILRAWINPLTTLANEVFFMANDPNDFNRTIGPLVPTVMLPRNVVVFNYDSIVETYNPLDPTIYPKYSSGEWFEEIQMKSYFTDYLQLQKPGYTRDRFVGTHQRLSQYLPWMEMGMEDGNLYFNGLMWKCYDNGLSCIPEDIWDHLSGEYSPFMGAPDGFLQPNIDEWTYFKNKIDDRRNQRKPDIIIPEVNINPHPYIRYPSIDPRVKKALTSAEGIQFYFKNGTVHLALSRFGYDITHLFSVDGVVRFSVKETLSGQFEINLKINGVYRDLSTGSVITRWTNPLTGKTVNVPPIEERLSCLADRSQVYTLNMTDLPDSSWNSIGLLFTNSSTNSNEDAEDWSVDMIGMTFFDSELNHSKPNFFGTFVRFSNWLKWMNTGNLPGKLFHKIQFYTQE